MTDKFQDVSKRTKFEYYYKLHLDAHINQQIDFIVKKQGALFCY